MNVVSVLRRRLGSKTDEKKRFGDGDEKLSNGKPKDKSKSKAKANAIDKPQPGEPRLLNKQNIIAAWYIAISSLPKIAKEVLLLDPTALLMNFVFLVSQGIAPAYSLYLNSQFMDLVQAAMAGKETDFDRLLRLAILKIVIGTVESITRKLKSRKQAEMERALDTQFEEMHLKTNATLGGQMLQHADEKLALKLEEGSLFVGLSYSIRRRDSSIRSPAGFVEQVIHLVTNTIQAVSQVWILILTFRKVGQLEWDTYLLISMSFISPLVTFLSQKSRKTKQKEYRSMFQNSHHQRRYVMKSLLTRKLYLAEVVLFGLGEWIVEQFRISNELVQNERKSFKIRPVFSLSTLPIEDAVSVAMQVIVVSRAASSSISLGSITLLQSTVRSVINYFRHLARISDDIFQTLFLVDAFFNTIEFAQKHQASGVEYEPDGKGMKIEARNLSFQYPDTEKLVLDNINFTISAGETVAIVGYNGSGKTTLSKLLCGLMLPKSSEQLLINDLPSTGYRPDSLHKATTVCLQDYVRFCQPVKENIGLGYLPLLKADDERALNQAASRGGADAFIDRLPKKFDTVLDAYVDEDQTKDNGPQALSGGQWQKLALSRAFIHPNPSLMILDEPSASLDARAEQEFFARLNEHATGRTTIFISHRFSTVRRADRIFFLEEGKLVESGTHKELIRIEGGRYRGLFELQASAFA